MEGTGVVMAVGKAMLQGALGKAGASVLDATKILVFIGIEQEGLSAEEKKEFEQIHKELGQIDARIQELEQHFEDFVKQHEIDIQSLKTAIHEQHGQAVAVIDRSFNDLLRFESYHTTTDLQSFSQNVDSAWNIEARVLECSETLVGPMGEKGLLEMWTDWLILVTQKERTGIASPFLYDCYQTLERRFERYIFEQLKGVLVVLNAYYFQDKGKRAERYFEEYVQEQFKPQVDKFRWCVEKLALSQLATAPSLFHTQVCTPDEICQQREKLFQDIQQIFTRADLFSAVLLDSVIGTPPLKTNLICLRIIESPDIDEKSAYAYCEKMRSQAKDIGVDLPLTEIELIEHDCKMANFTQGQTWETRILNNYENSNIKIVRMRFDDVAGPDGILGSRPETRISSLKQLFDKSEHRWGKLLLPPWRGLDLGKPARFLGLYDKDTLEVTTDLAPKRSGNLFMSENLFNLPYWHQAIQAFLSPVGGRYYVNQLSKPEEKFWDNGLPLEREEAVSFEPESDLERTFTIFVDWDNSGSTKLSVFSPLFTYANERHPVPRKLYVELTGVLRVALNFRELHRFSLGILILVRRVHGQKVEDHVLFRSYEPDWRETKYSALAPFYSDKSFDIVPGDRVDLVGSVELGWPRYGIPKIGTVHESWLGFRLKDIHLAWAEWKRLG